MSNFAGITPDAMWLLAENRFHDSKSFYEEKKPQIQAQVLRPLRALLEDACKGGLGACAVLVEGTAFVDLWLDVHSTLRIYESGERTVELKGTAKSA